MACPGYLEIFLFMDGITIYTIGYLGQTNTKQVIFFKNSKKVLKAVKKQIQEIKKLNANYTIFLRNYTDLKMDNFRKLTT